MSDVTVAYEETLTRTRQQEASLGELGPCESSICSFFGLTDMSLGSNSAAFAHRFTPQMPRGRICMVCAECDMGKTGLLLHVVSAHAEVGATVRYEDFQGYTASEVIGKLEELYLWMSSIADDGPAPLLACDNIPAADEADVDRQVQMIRQIAYAGCNIMLSMLPEAEAMCACMSEAAHYWSCDLCMPRPTSGPQQELFDAYTHGIPALHEALRKLTNRPTRNIMAEPTYLESYVQQISGLLRPGIIGEELRLRAAMLLVGSGKLVELSTIVGDVDEVLWRQLSRDAPFFGVNVSARSFCCVGAQSVDGISVAHHVLGRILADCPNLVSSAARLLAERGDMARAAVVSLLCSDKVERAAIGLAWGPDFINVGEGAVTMDALTEAREQGGLGLAGFYETECTFMALSTDRWGSVAGARAELHLATRQGRQADMALWCRGMLRGESLEAQYPLPEGADELSLSLALHGHAVSLMLCGRLEDAYNALINSAFRHRPDSIVSVLINMDYLLCSLLIGVGPSSEDLSVWEEGGSYLERIGQTQLLTLHDVLPSAAGLLGGRLKTPGAYEVQVQRADRSGDTLLRGVFLLVSAICDLRDGVFTRGHVRLQHAIVAFERTGARELLAMTRILSAAVRVQLGERIRKPELDALRGTSTALDKVISIVLAALAPARDVRTVNTSRWGTPTCPKDVHWLLNVLAHDCGSFSQRFQEVMPPAWRDSVIRGASEVDAALDCGETLEVALASMPLDELEERLQTRRTHAPAKVEVNLLGGFEVRVNGIQIPGKRLERRRAKSMMALLAAVPGHVAKRYAIMESIWPSYDYDTANKCVYSATSVLRSEFQIALGKQDAMALVLANKAERTVSLNAECVTCDIDQFEGFAHKLLDAEGQDRTVVTLCREVEDLYRGDLFVPPTDGAGIVERRRRELRDLFADALVAGATAATRLGMRTLACRFARKAHEADLLREDAVRALVIALCAVGRQAEAEQCYESYVAHVVDVTRRPPSRKLRELMSELMEGVSRREHSAHEKGELLPPHPSISEILDEGEGHRGDAGDPPTQLQLRF